MCLIHGSLIPKYLPPQAQQEGLDIELRAKEGESSGRQGLCESIYKLIFTR